MSEAMDLNQSSSSSWKQGVVLGVVVLVIGGLLYWGVSSLSGGKSGGPKRQVVKIAVLPDTPPPPPPPPKDEKKPEPEKQDLKPQQQEQPKPQEAPPEPQQLKMEGAAGDGPSAFAAGQVTQDYKSGDVGVGSGAAVNRMQFVFFTNRLTKHIQAELARQGDLKGRDYRVNVRVWMSQGGTMQRVELASSTGDEVTDRLLKDALAQLPGIDQMPPDLPQPLSLRITNRMTG